MADISEATQEMVDFVDATPPLSPSTIESEPVDTVKNNNKEKEEHAICPLHNMVEAEAAVASGKAVPATIEVNGVHCLCPGAEVNVTTLATPSNTVSPSKLPFKKRTSKRQVKRVLLEDDRQRIIKKARSNLMSLADSFDIQPENFLFSPDRYKRGDAVHMLRHSVRKLATVNQIAINAMLMFEQTADSNAIAMLASCIDCLVADHRTDNDDDNNDNGSDEDSKGEKGKKKPIPRTVPDAFIIHLENAEPKEKDDEDEGNDDEAPLPPSPVVAEDDETRG